MLSSRTIPQLCRGSNELSRASPSRELWGCEAGVTCSVAVSLREACPCEMVSLGKGAWQGRQLSPQQSWLGVSASCSSGVVSDKEGGALLCLPGALGLFSASILCRGGTEVTAWPHPAIPTQGMHTPNPFQRSRTLFLT